MTTPTNAAGDAQELAQTCVALRLQLEQRRAAYYAQTGVDASELMTPDAAQHQFEVSVQNAIRRYFGECLESAVSSRPSSAEAPMWLVSLEGPAKRTAQVFVCSMGSENDVREIARVRMGRGWSTITADRTSQRGQAGFVSRASLPASFRATGTVALQSEAAPTARRRARP